MKNKPYRKKPGDLEIRILNNGKVVMVAPDETLIEIAQVIDPRNRATQPQNGNERACQKTKNQHKMS